MKIKIDEHTTKDPLALMGKMAGECWGAPTNNTEKNIARAKDCITSGHNRVLEYPQVYFTVSDISARLMREIYTHIGGLPTRLQASTRYIDYQSGFNYVIPPAIAKNEEALYEYLDCMNYITASQKKLEKLGIPREDIAMELPLAMTTIVSYRTNARHLIDMSRVRDCNRAYWEYQAFMQLLEEVLSDYSDEWKYIVHNCFHAKCEEYGFCTEKNSCGRFPKRG